MIYAMRKLFFDPCVDTFPRLFGGDVYFTMQVRRDSQHKFPGEGFFRLLAELAAIFQIVLYGIPESLFNFFNGFPLEGDYVGVLITSPWKISASSSNSTWPM